MKEAIEGRYKDISNQKFGLLTPRRFIGYTEKISPVDGTQCGFVIVNAVV